MTIQIDVARREDCRALAEVHVESWQQAYKHIIPAAYLDSLSIDERETMWLGALDQQATQVLVARSGEDMAGFVCFGPSRDDDAPPARAEIWSFYVRPAFWSAGFGYQLWQASRLRLITAGYKAVTLWVIVGNDRARHFYERVGFVVEAGSTKRFSLGGTELQEIRYAVSL